LSDYRNAHNAVRRERGPATLYPCVWCRGDAAQWAYAHNDPDERTDGPRGARYSFNADHYGALCIRCHRTFDRLLREGATFERFYRAFRRARTRYPSERVAGMAERRAQRRGTYMAATGRAIRP
jgi:hypothetical protein